MDDTPPSQQKIRFLHIAGLILLGILLIGSLITWVARYIENPAQPTSVISIQK
ncbi:hypothetical protein Thini_4324 [Thiothrix nivea DSM 5205]|uniref:Uncharacterized protein n=1 Tax=Thiothrix nivea (strain ATCC 35100 / DSM 5205 / JP2) TaxID=870187 RepID=A0A656HMQ5_THINJ|nr:hypothetical protein Thini_4324 [Thiothrix nivea DSM 5205]